MFAVEEKKELRQLFLHSREPGFYLRLKCWLLNKGVPKHELDYCPDVPHLKLCMQKHGVSLSECEAEGYVGDSL